MTTPWLDLPTRDNHRVLMVPAGYVATPLAPSELNDLESFFLAVGRLTEDVQSLGWGDEREALALIDEAAR